MSPTAAPTLAASRMPRPLRARAAATARRQQQQQKRGASRPAAAAAAASDANPRLPWNHAHHAEPATLPPLHETLYADTRGAVHYREDPRDDRRAVLVALRSMELLEQQFDGASEHGSSGSGPSSSSPSAPRRGGVAKASGRRTSWQGDGHAARERLSPKKFLRGARAVKHTHMVDQPMSRRGVAA
jgi:hypothetical protein